MISVARRELNVVNKFWKGLHHVLYLYKYFIIYCIMSERECDISAILCWQHS